MYSFKLTDLLTGDTITVDNQLTTPIAYRKAPVNWNKLNYTFTRNEKYYGLFPSFTAQLGFCGSAKVWLDDLFWLNRINNRISVIVKAFNPKTMQFELFLDGMVNMETFSVKQFQTDIEIVDSLFINDILNKDSTDLDYQKMIDTYSIDHRDNWNDPSFTSLRIFGLATENCPSGFVDAYAVYPFQLFEQLVALITGSKGRFCSSFFGKTSDKDENGSYYLNDGEGARMMVTTGRFIRGYTKGDLKKGTGTITTNHFSKTIVGISTNFLAEIESRNDIMDDAGQSFGLVDAIISDNELTLLENATYDYSGTFQYQNQSDSATLIISFEKLFKSFSNIFKLGMSIKYNNDDLPFVSIESLNNYYQDEVMINIDNPKNITIGFDVKWHFNSIDVGYGKSQKNQSNLYGNTEYNNKSSYTVPALFVKKSLSIVSDIRADGTAIQMLMDAKKSSAVDTSQNQLDGEIFIISSMEVDELLRSKNDDGINISIGSIYGNNPKINPDISPARMLLRWGDMIRISLNEQLEKSLIFNRQESLSRMTSLKEGESDPVTEGANIPINSLDEPFLNGVDVNFTSPLGIADILSIKANPFKLVKHYNPIANSYQYGWVNEASMQPIDKITNWKIAMMSDYVAPIQRKWKLKYLSGEYIEFLETGNMLLLNQN